MINFHSIASVTGVQTVRAWCVEQAIESLELGDFVTDETITSRAAKIEDYVLNGKKADNVKVP